MVPNSQYPQETDGGEPDPGFNEAILYTRKIPNGMMES
jgi:hypothetical protein